MVRKEKTKKAVSPKVLLLIAAFFFVGAAAFFVWSPGEQIIQIAEDWFSGYSGNKQSQVPVATTIRLTAVGDVMMSRTVADVINSHNDPCYPFKAVKSQWTASDLLVGNFENPAIDGSRVVPYQMILRADTKSISGLTCADFTGMSLANNHMGDQGTAGVESTLSLFSQAGIAAFGAGENYEQAHKVTIIEKKNIKIGFLAYADTDFTPTSSGATASKPGIALMDKTALKQDIDAAKEQVDFLVVMMHSGVEYQVLPDSAQKDFARAAIDDGADLVLGGHPHVLEPYELYSGKFIFYSLGNFVFDQNQPGTQDSVILTLTISFPEKSIIGVEATPVSIKGYAQPIVDIEHKTSIFKNFYLMK